ncbi:IS30 family transposase [Dysosmobacter sp.]|jgi:IS30 family transposase|uniref:IS30 family transposase n=1 Tax=Dysosmobacter sp. TaxID=2591382 RepID=UPI002F9236ED
MAERKKYKHLRWEDRLKMEGALKTGAKPDEIAEMLGCCRATVYNEIKRGQCLQQHDAEFVMEYCADFAERKYQENLRAKGPELKIGHDHALANFIEDKIILDHYSPCATLAFIKEQGLQFDTQLCANTIYNYIYRGDVFLNLTPEHLLYKGERRSPEDKQDQDRAREAPGRTIEQRPWEIWARETFGHWEMDSLMGTIDSEAALVVLTERLTRYGLIFRVPDHTMESVVKVLNRLERRLGKDFRRIFRSITVDNGSEFQDCAGMERSVRNKRPRTTIYYCHPSSPGERGSNENMNRIIRRFFPKGTNFDEVTAQEVAQAEVWMNNYPRAILEWKSAGALFAKYLTA